jgi:hypothetical protein
MKWYLDYFYEYLDRTSRLFLQKFILNLIRTDYAYEE